MLDKQKNSVAEILTTGQIAKICRVDPRTVNRWIDEGILKAYELPVTGFKRVCIEDFLTFLRAHKIPLAEEHRHLTRPRILIVDDEPSISRSIRRALAYPADAYDFEFAEDGFDAGNKIAAFKPDLILLDVLMPKLDGFGVLAKIRQNPDTRHIQVLVMSALIPAAERERTIAQGADDFLPKPFEEEELKMRVTRLLSRKGSK